SFWFYTGDPQGGASFYIFDSTGSNLMTVVSMGADIGVGINPGNVDWVDGGFIAPGPAFAPFTWNNITIRYDCNVQTFDAVWNGVVQGTYAFFDPAIDLTYVEFYGGAIDAPADFYFDDMYLWIDDPPATPQNLHVDMPPLPPSIENNHTVDQDNAVDGVVTNTFANIDEIVLPHDGLTEDIQEVLMSGGAAPITDRANNDYIDTAVNEGAVGGGTLADLNDGDNNGYYQLTETETGGAPASRYSALGWIFDVPVTGGTDVEFFVQAYHDVDADGDDFTFQYSNAAAGPWTDMVTVTATADPGTYQSYSDATLDAFSGTLYIRVRDTDWTAGNNNHFGSIFIDDMYIISMTGAPDYMGLEHRWRTENVPAGSTTLELQVTAATSVAPDDTFSFGYSTVLGGPYTSVLTVNSAVMGTYTAGIPIALNGQFYINVVDDSAADPAQADSIIIEAITIYWQQVVGGASTTQIATADNPVAGGVVGTFALTNPPADAPPDGNAQQFTEVDASSAPHEPIEFAPGPGPEPQVTIGGPYDFAAGFPAGWTEYLNAGSVSANTWFGPVSISASGLPAANLGDDNCMGVNWDTPRVHCSMDTETFDFSAFQNVAVTFDHFMTGTWGEMLFLEYSLDGGGVGGTWNAIADWTADGSSTDWNIRGPIL
ncbi:hypothetical protein KAU11_06365, partial [Candidatus Babeliales bacterium]|nr:hypothetical protein [Candidatus Babeliales bacterium]